MQLTMFIHLNQPTGTHLSLSNVMLCFLFFFFPVSLSDLEIQSRSPSIFYVELLLLFSAGGVKRQEFRLSMIIDNSCLLL